MPCLPRLASLVMLLSLACASTRATGLRAAPTRIVLDPASSSTQLVLGNTDHAPLRIRIRLYAWTQEHGQDRLLPSRDMAVSPHAIEILPGAQQLVRVIRLGAVPMEREGSYRIIIEQLPRPGVHGPQTVLRYSAPVFAPPHVAGTHLLAASLQRQGPSWLLRVDNRGTRHARLADLEYREPSGGRTTIAHQLAGYVLPGQFKTWPLPARADGYLERGFAARIDQDTQPLALLPLAPR